ncbi:MAG: YgiT-type zinc finger protein [Pelolinea sp.]|nr:YgiT-type zinc finger protein [Pelolinea sp.]
MRRFIEPLSMIPCSDCSIGQMRQTTVTYFTFLSDRMITVPDFPAWVCDMCGKCEYDLEALDNLALMLCPQDADNPAKRRSRSNAKGKAAPPRVHPTTSK